MLFCTIYGLQRMELIRLTDHLDLLSFVVRVTHLENHLVFLIFLSDIWLKKTSHCSGAFARLSCMQEHVHESFISTLF